MKGPYREPDFRCEATRLRGERCILPIGHRGMHVVSGGDCWVMAGDAAEGRKSAFWMSAEAEARHRDEQESDD